MIPKSGHRFSTKIMRKQSTEARQRSALAFPHLLDQPIQPRRGAHELRSQALLQPLAHGVANRPAGLAIDLLANLRFKANHGGFRGRFGCGSCTQGERDRAGNVSAAAPPGCQLGKICMKGRAVMHMGELGLGFDPAGLEPLIAMIDKPPAGSPGCRQQLAPIAEAIAVGHRNAVDIGRTPYGPRGAAPASGQIRCCCRHHCHHCQKSAGQRCHLAFTKHVALQSGQLLPSEIVVNPGSYGCHFPRPRRLPSARAVDISAANSHPVNLRTKNHGD